MKTVHVFVIKPEDCALMEKTLNMFRIGLNDWDKTKLLEVKGQNVHVYTVVCDEDVRLSIKNVIKNSKGFES